MSAQAISTFLAICDEAKGLTRGKTDVFVSVVEEVDVEDRLSGDGVPDVDEIAEDEDADEDDDEEGIADEVEVVVVVAGKEETVDDEVEIIDDTVEVVVCFTIENEGFSNGRLTYSARADHRNRSRGVSEPWRYGQHRPTHCLKLR